MAFPHTTAEYKAALAKADLRKAEKLWETAQRLEAEAADLHKTSTLHPRALRDEKRRLLDRAAALRTEARTLAGRAAT